MLGTRLGTGLSKQLLSYLKHLSQMKFMSSIDDILNNPGGQSFALNPGRTIAELMHGLDTIKLYNIRILKHQELILQHLTTGTIDDVKAGEAL